MGKVHRWLFWICVILWFYFLFVICLWCSFYTVPFCVLGSLSLGCFLSWCNILGLWLSFCLTSRCILTSAYISFKVIWCYIVFVYWAFEWVWHVLFYDGWFLSKIMWDVFGQSLYLCPCWLQSLHPSFFYGIIPSICIRHS